MRKLSIFLFAVIALMACSESSETYQVQQVSLKTPIDSLNYVDGYCVALSILRGDFNNSPEAVTDFVNALEAAYNGAEEVGNYAHLDSIYAQKAFQIGHTIREHERGSGLMGFNGLETDFDLIKMGFINGLYGDTTNIAPDAAFVYINAEIAKLAEAQYVADSIAAAEAATAAMEAQEEL